MALNYESNEAAEAEEPGSEGDKGTKAVVVGAPFIKSVELRSRPAALFYVLLYAKSTIPNARHDSRAIF